MKGVFNPFQTIDNMLATLYAETSSYILDAKTAAKKAYEERILKK